MSEQKRVPTQTLELSGSLVNATKKEKKGEKSKQLVPSFRFELSLDDKNEKGYSEFNYAHLYKSAEVSEIIMKNNIYAMNNEIFCL